MESAFHFRSLGSPREGALKAAGQASLEPQKRPRLDAGTWRLGKACGGNGFHLSGTLTFLLLSYKAPTHSEFGGLTLTFNPKGDKRLRPGLITVV